MRRTDRSSLILAAGLWVSLAVHAALGLGLARYAAAEVLGVGQRIPATGVTEPEPEFPAEKPPKPPKTRELQLGVRDGAPGTLTWLGFKEATDHGARQGSIEQSAVSLDPGSGGVPAGSPGTGSTSVAAAQTEPREAVMDERPLMPEAPAPETVADAPRPPSPPPLTRESVEAMADRLLRATRDAAEATEQLAASVQELFEAPPSPPATKPATAQPPQPAAAPASSGSGGMPGIESDREAIAVAVKNAPGVAPGKVLAAEGLEILTRRPRFSVTTMLTNRPRNPTVEVVFGRDGRVIRAVFVTDGKTVYNTGAAEVDQPLLNAIYTWSARGKALDELDPADPGAGVKVMFTILLGG